MTSVPKKSKPTARQKLAQSQLSSAAQTQRQGMRDIDLDKLHILLNGKLGVDATQSNLDVVLERSIEGASTATVSVEDDALKLLQSGFLAQKLDIEIDGLFFRLNAFKKNQDQISLIFEDREVNELRQHKKKLGPIPRTKITRAEFALKIIREPKRELTIDFFIPELHTIQAVTKAKDTQTWGTTATSSKRGIPTGSGAHSTGAASEPPVQQAGERSGLTVKKNPMTDTQIKVANSILDAGTSQNARRKVLVCAIMAAIQESGLTNEVCKADPGSPVIRCGVYRQDPRYWPASRDVEKDASAFFQKAIGIDRSFPNLNYYELCEQVQGSGQPTLYSPWRTEAEHIVTTYGVPGGDKESAVGSTTDPTSLGGGGDYFFYRGTPPTDGSTKWKTENSWDCLQRLASEVQWRCFCIAGRIYFVTENYLFKSQPAAKISQGDRGIIDISGDFDQGKPTSMLTIQAEIKRWAAPPGSVVQIVDMGPLNGKWLVTNMRRSVYNTDGEITIKKPLPFLPEPLTSNLQNGMTFNYNPQKKADYRTDSTIVNPIPPGRGGNTGALHPTGGLPDYPAYDFFAAPGTRVLAVESGEITKMSGHDPSLGPVEGVGGPLGWSIYLKGDNSGTTYFMTHLGARFVSQGQPVAAGDVIGTVADYDKYAGKGFSHVHIGVHGGTVTPDMLKNAPYAIDSQGRGGDAPKKTSTTRAADKKQQPLFTREGPDLYAAAFAHNSPFAVDAPYQVTLSSPDEAAFRAWVASKNVPFDPNAATVDYDMRQYWRDFIKTGRTVWQPGHHFPDDYKTPYDTTFSRESVYATKDCPFVWKNGILVDNRNGQVIFR